MSFFVEVQSSEGTHAGEPGMDWAKFGELYRAKHGAPGPSATPGPPPKAAAERSRKTFTRGLHAGMLQTMEAARDLDYPALDHHAGGTRVCVNLRAPRAPAIFEKRLKWKLEHVLDSSQETRVRNAISAQEQRVLLKQSDEKACKEGKEA